MRRTHDGNAPAAAQVLDVLTYLASRPGPVPARQVAEDLGLPRSTTYQLLATLTSRGYAIHVPEARRYGVGVAAFEVGFAYAQHEPLARVGRGAVAGLADATGACVHLSALHGREVVYIVEERPPAHPPLITQAGVRLPAAQTASGRAMLAELSGEQVRALYPDSAAFGGVCPPAPCSPSALRADLADVRRAGFATENGWVRPGFASIAVPIRDHRDHPFAAICLTHALDKAHDARDIVAQLRDCAERVRTAIGAARPTQTGGARRADPERKARHG